MKILAHKLHDATGEAVPFRRSPNQSSGTIQPEFLVIHYTAGTSSKGSVDWLCNPIAKASAHLVVGRDGEATQLVDFNRKAWHAGRSHWDNREGANGFSIGIELDNAGRLDGAPGSWRSWQGVSIPDDEVVVRRHPADGRESGWHTYSTLQIEATTVIAATLVAKYQLRDVIGHEDISPGRKVDPGPAFPMGSFRSKVMGRAEDHEQVFATTTALNIRVGPGSQFDKLRSEPLPQGTRVEVLRSEGVWRFVDVLEPSGTDSDLVGWAHGRFLKPVV
jgi:N-acetylmuramoyl-L-alanine amidase